MDNDDITPTRVIREETRWIPAAIVTGVLLTVAFGIAVFICWQAHAWLFTQQAKLQNNVYQNSYGTQQANLQEMETAVQAIPGAVSNGQIRADVNDACAAGARVTQLPAGDASWYAANCDGPAMSPNSVYQTAQP